MRVGHRVLNLLQCCHPVVTKRVGWESVVPVVEAWRWGGSALPHCVSWSPFWDLTFPICTREGPFYSDIICHCQEDFPSTCCLDKLCWPLSHDLGGRMRLRVGSGQDSVALPGCSFP